jgi:DNA-binding CsgD family transcriptional regulator
MGKRGGLNQTDILRVMRHLADVAALKGNPPAQRQVLVDGLNALIGTDAGFFYVADEWRPGRRPHFSSYTLSTDHDPLFVKYTSEFGIKFPLEDDPYCFQSLPDRRTNQTWTSRDVMPDRDAERRHANFMDLKRSGRVRDGVVSFFRTGVDQDRIIGFGMHRFGKTSNLRGRDVALASFASREIRSLVERGHLALTSAAPPDLPPRLRQILDRLLAGGTPKRIAHDMGLSLWTVREHIQRLYRFFGVNGREALTARFVRPDGAVAEAGLSQ